MPATDVELQVALIGLAGVVLGVLVGAWRRQIGADTAWRRQHRLDSYAEFVIAFDAFHQKVEDLYRRRAKDQVVLHSDVQLLNESLTTMIHVGQRIRLVGSERIQKPARDFEEFADKLLTKVIATERPTPEVWTELTGKEYEGVYKGWIKLARRDVQTGQD